MLLADLTLATPAENLAADEVLLDQCEAGASPGVLRFWEPATYFVVLGYANKAATEANLGYCRAHDIPVLRRCSGGGTVLQGPGCLNYSLVLRIEDFKSLQSIRTANAFIMERHRAVFSSLLQTPVAVEGHTDLAIGGRKFSGNAQRRRKRCLLFHGSFLLRLDLDLVERTLTIPSVQPAYRANRSHTEFVTNLPSLTPAQIKRALVDCWGASQPLPRVPQNEIREYVAHKYALDEWNLKF